MVQPGTGEVRALAQSRPMGSAKSKGETYLNYVVPRRYGDANGFQAGSTFKAFVLSAAINQGIPLSTRINAPQTISIPENRYRTCHGHLLSTDVWSPENSTGAGTFDLYKGTQQSVNTFFAQLEERTGLCAPTTLARKMGVVVPDRDVVGPFTLGVTDVDPLTMAGVYATFAARGTFCPARPVTGVLNSTGRTLEDYPPAVPSAAAQRRRGCRERHPPRRPGARRLRVRRRSRSQPALGRQDRHDHRQQGGLVHRLHPEPRDRLDDRGRQLAGAIPSR